MKDVNFSDWFFIVLSIISVLGIVSAYGYGNDFGTALRLSSLGVVILLWFVYLPVKEKWKTMTPKSKPKEQVLDPTRAPLV